MGWGVSSRRFGLEREGWRELGLERAERRAPTSTPMLQGDSTEVPVKMNEKKINHRKKIINKLTLKKTSKN